MNRDPLYQRITDALAGPLDGDKFEECAVALLCKAYANLAPMPGGDDAGMDGAFGTHDGPYPLICTVQSNVIGNFRKNITTYLAKCKGPRLAVVATPKKLSNVKRRNLQREADKLGVRIVNIHDLAYFANQLYRDSKWRLELLGITGDPPALSALPRTGRFAQPEIVIGRQTELTWLKEVEGDALLVGQPGSGKTYLHQSLAMQGLCLFAVDGSRARLADAIREQEPSIIVVDDAHIEQKLVEDLKRLRVEQGATYRIHLNCWPSYEANVQQILDIPSSRVLHLMRLRNREILDIIKRMGIDGPDWLQHLLISQSDGKPGLAVALAGLCRSENIEKIWSGEAAARQLLGNPRLVNEEDDRCVLAAFAVGGDAGMSFGQVSKAIGLSKLVLRRVAAKLGSGGLIQEVEADRLQVRPPAIRAVLVRDVFYGGATSLPIDKLLNGTISVPSTATVLISARQRGAAIDKGLLERLAVAANTDDVWEHFAYLDSESASIILDRYPEHAHAASRGLMCNLPNRALHFLIGSDRGGDVSGLGSIGQSRQRLSEWLFPIETPELTIERRGILLQVLKERANNGEIGNGLSFARALAESIRVDFDVAKLSPGNSREFRCITGVASGTALDQIIALWPQVKSLIPHVPSAAIRTIFNQVETWCLPQRLALKAELGEDTRAALQAHGCQMLSDLMDIPTCNRAWRTRAAAVVKWAKLHLQVAVDPTFEAIFADRDFTTDWEAEEKRKISELQSIASELMQLRMDAICQFLTTIRSEASDFEYRNGSMRLSIIYHHIAMNCQRPAEWLDMLVVQQTSSELLAPFLDRLGIGGSSDYENGIRRLIKIPDYHALAISRVLRMPTPNDELVSTALALLGAHDLAEHLWLRDPAIPLSVMKKVLEYPNPNVRAAGAAGEWQRDPARAVRPEIEAQWRAAVLEIEPNHYILNDIFEEIPALAFQWLQSQLRSGNRRLSVYDQGFRDAAGTVSAEERSQLLCLLSRNNYSDACFDLLLGEDTNLFAGWLDYQQDEVLRLMPLNRDMSPRWEKMASMALDAGVSPEELSNHCTTRVWGGDPQYFADQIAAYEALVSHRDMRLRLAGKRGLEVVQERARRESAREHREETYCD